MTENMLKAFLIRQKRVDTADLLTKFRESDTIEKDPLTVWCINPVCGKVIKVSDQSQRQIQCNACMAQMCLKCKRAWHGNIECDDVPIAQPPKHILRPTGSVK